MKISDLFIVVLVVILLLLFTFTTTEEPEYDREIPKDKKDSHFENKFKSNKSEIPEEKVDPFVIEEDFHDDNDPIEVSSNFLFKKEALYNSLPSVEIFGIRNPMIYIKRNSLLQTSFDEVMKIPIPIFKSKRMSVKFVGEIGIDAGGICKEWMNLIISKLLDEKTGLFVLNDSNQAFPVDKELLKTSLTYYKFLGRIIARLIIDKNCANVYFNIIVYKLILKIPVETIDFINADEGFYNGLNYLKEDLMDQYFVNSFDKELKNNGSNIKVTEDNVDEFIDLSLKSKFIDGISEQCELIRQGIFEIIDEKLFKDWSAYDFKLLICGHTNIDMEDWKINTRYKSFNKNDITIKWFWEILESFSEKDKSRFLHFITGSSRVPPLGFSELRSNTGSVMKFQIIKVSIYRLPVAHTCINALDLSEYSSKNKLEEDLKEAVANSNQGFYLS